MATILSKKLNRYEGLFKEIENWPEYLLYKLKNNGKGFTFKLRSSYSITVPKQAFPPFKEIFFDRVYLNNIQEKLKLHENPTILDIGANVGYFSLYMLFHYPKARVYAFEPMPNNYAKILEYKEHYRFSGLHAINKAVTDDNAGITINYSDKDTFTTVASVYSHSSNAKQLEVESVNLETVLNHYKIDKVDFLKMDCEGSEFAILYAASPSVLKRIKAMAVETHQGDKKDENLAALAAFLQKNGFSIKISKEKGETDYVWAWQ